MTKRLIITQPTSPIQTEVITVPTLDTLLNDALFIIGSELARYRAKTARGISLDLKEARAVRDYVESIVKMSKESREAARQQDLSNLTNEELLELATNLLAKKE